MTFSMTRSKLLVVDDHPLFREGISRVPGVVKRTQAVVAPLRGRDSGGDFLAAGYLGPRPLPLRASMSATILTASSIDP